MFMPRAKADRPSPVPVGSTNLALISQFVEIPEDAVFTVEYPVRVAQIAVYQLLGIDVAISPILHHAKSAKVQMDAVIKAFR
jgi:oleate hydratase